MILIKKLRRRVAVERILTCSRTSSLRKFAMPDVNFSATNYRNIIDWEVVSISEPPIFQFWSDEKLFPAIDNHLTDANNLPNHTQAVERNVQLVSTVSRIYNDQNTRHEVVVSSSLCRN